MYVEIVKICIILFKLVNPDIVEKLADKKNAEACKERFLTYPYFAVYYLCIFSTSAS